MPDEVVVEVNEDGTAEPSSDGDTTIVVTGEPATIDTTAIDHEGRITRLEDLVTVQGSALQALSDQVSNAQMVSEVAIEVASEAAETAVVAVEEVAAVEEEQAASETPVTEDEPPTSKRHRWWR